MTNRILAVGLIVLLLATAPYWLKGASAIADTIANSLQSVGIASETEGLGVRAPVQVNIRHRIESQRPFSFSFNYQDGESTISIWGTNERARVEAEFSGSAWERIKKGFSDFLRSIGIQITVTNRGEWR
jgi:hypothetical protein